MQSLARSAKFKRRSYETSRDRHLPALQTHPNEPSIVLLGDSMLERMITTGLTPSFQPWPSRTMISNDSIAHLCKEDSAPTIRRLRGVFNAGVGGDKFENIIYRLVGSSTPENPLDSLLDTLRNRDVKLWVLHAGTNNLRPRRGLSDSDLSLLRRIIEALLEAGGKVLLTGLFRRKNIDDELVAKANESYRRMVDEFREDGNSRVEFLPAPKVDLETCLVDDVHLNVKGYQIWSKPLLQKCPGYADPWTVVHRQQNASAAHQVQVRVAKRLKERGDATFSVRTGGAEGSSPESHRSDSSEEEEVVRRSMTMPQYVQCDTEVYSMRHFYSNYTSGNEVGFFNLMFDLKPPRDSPGVFEEAVKATALASSSLQLCQAGMMAQAKQHYGKALVRLSAALRDTEKAKDDSVVVALLTLGLFEAIIPDKTPSKIASHCRGSLALLRYRAEQGIATSLDKASLAFIAQLGILEIFIGQEGRSPILMGLTQAAWAQGGVVESLIARAIDYKFVAQKMIVSPDIHDASVDTVTEVFRTGIGIIRDLEAAANYRVTSPSPRQTLVDGMAEPGVSSFNGLLNRNSETSNAIAKGLYLTVRLHIVEQVLSLLIALGEPTREQLSTLVDLPHGLTALEQVCEQIRVIFGFDGRETVCKNQGMGFQAWAMFWPMIAVLKSALADQDTKLWVLDKCLTVSQASGFGMAMYQMGWFNGGHSEMKVVD
ncbi:hypothetical protein CkaCkLH20_09233 [Colletotrichum karsti]|uniref:SGNH hydrolase-type esterase domain-containing protein n=1 Tax=Colletotrichum karsti TaxID=1095194 RepID=A0A9P6LI90_9PEZI|nr:uncharacterized protein CkaCkLH20_09233 [Colletotrichum karsti]KAF9873420.1 hypothetical protein CkaCkLH20_09233 [Colletotrichum karsti]